MTSGSLGIRQRIAPFSADMPIEYQSPFAQSSRSAVTPYLAIVGGGTAWPEAGPTKRSDITGQTVNTVLIVEAANSDIDWMEPRDMPFHQAVLGVHRDDTRGIRSYFDDGLHVLTAGGNAETLPTGISVDLLSSAFTIRAGKVTEQIDGRLITRLKDRAPGTCLDAEALALQILSSRYRNRKSEVRVDLPNHAPSLECPKTGYDGVTGRITGGKAATPATSVGNWANTRWPRTMKTPAPSKPSEANHANVLDSLRSP